MKPERFLSVIFLAASLLVACSGSPAILPAGSAIQPTQSSESSPAQPAARSLVRVDNQGAVIVAVTPLNLDRSGETLDFEVAMNTHSVDLSMDLAMLATLSTDTGRTVEGILWNAPRGGHHVSGILSFPAAVDGTPLIDSTSNLTLTIRDVDAPERVFIWKVSK